MRGYLMVTGRGDKSGLASEFVGVGTILPHTLPWRLGGKTERWVHCLVVLAAALALGATVPHRQRLECEDRSKER